MKTKTNKHVCRPLNKRSTMPKHKHTSPKAAAQKRYTNPEQVQHVAQHQVCNEEWLRMHREGSHNPRLNATIARTETTAHLDGDLHRHGTQTPNLVHDCQRNVNDKMFTTLLLCSCSCTRTQSGCWDYAENTHAKKMSTRLLRATEITSLCNTIRNNDETRPNTSKISASCECKCVANSPRHARGRMRRTGSQRNAN